MKYEVIGWTYDSDTKYPEHRTITASVDRAIIKEIREHGYLFGGDAHENYCPVLNDGTLVSYSWRGWGRIMALAYEEEGEYAYMMGYMDSMIKEEARKYPSDGLVEDIRIVPKESLTETFVMHLTDEQFEKVKVGTKTIEIRLFDDKRKLVDIGDYIEFRKVSDENEHVIRKVSDILGIEKSFTKIFTKINFSSKEWEEVLRFSPQSLGAPEDSTIQSLVENMYQYYDKADEEKYGVIAFLLEEPKPACHTCFKALINDNERIQRYSEKMATASDEEFNWLLDNFSFDSEQIQAELDELASFDMRWDYLYYGENDTYEEDLNDMLRKTLAGLLGKEEQLKALQDKYILILQLEIYAVIIKDSSLPKQRLSLDKDIIEFLHKTNTQLKFGYKVI